MKKETDRSGTRPSPLGPALARFARRLEDGGYRKSTTDQYLSIGRKFDSYVARRRIALAAMREDHIDAFLVEATAGRRLRERGRCVRILWRIPLLQLLEQLRNEGVVPAADVPVDVPGPGLAEYLAFLREHRGCCERTVQRQRRHVGQFLAHLQARTEDDLHRIKIEQVDRHLVQASRRLRRQSIGSVCASLRGFLGHLHMRGVLPSNLRPQVSTPHIYPLEGMPRAVAWSEVERALATVDRVSVLGCRDYAILMLIAYCGLRAGDVATLQLPDLDWHRDTIHVRRPKGKTTDAVPLIPVVGEALIAYLQRRTETPHAEVFLTEKAPVVPLAGPRISAMARKYLKRAGVKAARLGSHTLRHSFAVELLRRGHSLRAIGDVLGHDHPQSTFIYTKGAVEDLREVTLNVEEVLP